MKIAGINAFVWMELYGQKWSDIHRSNQVSGRIEFGSSVAIQMNVNSVPHCLADIYDWDIGGAHPFGVPMAE